MNKIYFFICLFAFSSSCGDVDSNSSPTEYASINTTQESSSEKSSIIGKISLTSNKMCNHNSDSGLFQLTLSGTNSEQLDIKIKGFTKSNKKYTCTQASDNKNSSLGDKFESCMVELSLQSQNQQNTLNTYAMHRASEDIAALDYNSECSVDISYDSVLNKVSGTLKCLALQQTKYNGQNRNPLNSNVTIDITQGSTFFCDL